MKNISIIKKVVIFLGIISLGIIGLIIADQQDYISGRDSTEASTIGNGISDPLVSNEANVKTSAKLAPSKIIKEKTDVPPSIDGIKKTKK